MEDGKQAYFIDDFSSEEIKYKATIAISVLEDYVLMIDVCNQVNKLINISNAQKDAFWSVENEINGIQTLFHVYGIERLDHQEILEDSAYTIAVNTMGDDKNERALKIKAAFFEKLVSLKADL